MLRFDRLSIFEHHAKQLEAILPQQTLFFVGGCIRDVLLGITEKPHDLDITMAWKPDEIWESMHVDIEKISRFKTDKFGTMTLIPKARSLETGKQQISYEITPLRTEWGYEDFRHPGEINRSNDLLADSKRRDFTINCLYRHGTHFKFEEPTSNHGQQIIISSFAKEQLLGALQKHHTLYFEWMHLLVLQDHAQIEKIFANGWLDKDSLNHMIHSSMRVKSLVEGSSSNTPQNTEWLDIIIDPHGWLIDILTDKLRTVWNADNRFTEDALRIIRAIRFPNMLNQHPGCSFDYDKATRISMQHNAHLVKNLAKERIYQELVKVFKADNPFGYVCLLNELGLVETLFPALAATKGDVQPVRYHPFDTFNHTLLTLEACQKVNKNYLVKFAMLYHDVGKPAQYAYIREQKEKLAPEHRWEWQIDMSWYIHHAEWSVPLAQQDFQNLWFSNKEIEEICRYIRQHHKPGEVLMSCADQHEKKIRTLISEAWPKRVLNLIDLAIADRLGQFNPMQSPAIDELKELKKMVKRLHKEEGRFTMKQLAVDGNILMKEMNIQAGPRLGELLKIAFERTISDIKTRNVKEKILSHLQSL